MRTRRIYLRWILLAAVSGMMMMAGSSCKHELSEEEQLRMDADSFAVNYYNWHFEKALRFCTPESEKWLRFTASNVHQADVDSLRAKTKTPRLIWATSNGKTMIRLPQ